MEQIKIKNFLVIKEAIFDINKLNIIIGDQASGKSLLAKLSYFFKKLINKTLIDDIVDLQDNINLETSAKILFENYFPSYIWENTSFHILYKNDNFSITVDYDKSYDNFKFIFCDNFLKLKKDIEVEYDNFLNLQKNNISTKVYNFLTEIFSENRNLSYKNIFTNAIFIPARRSYFLDLQKNIFSLLSEKINIDIFIKEFGSHYERSKKVYISSHIRSMFSDFGTFKHFMSLILKGNFIYEKNQDWIEIDKNLINLSDASSGQQESLPMLIVLLEHFLIKQQVKRVNYIEEPEAHLFPTSQRYIVKLISLLHNRECVNFITTHSPYILTAINNLILAYDVMKNKGEDSIKGIIDKDFVINFDDVAAYTIENGVLTSIKDKKERLIGINIIDSVSDDFSEEFDKLLQLSL